MRLVEEILKKRAVRLLRMTDLNLEYPDVGRRVECRFANAAFEVELMRKVCDAMARSVEIEFPSQALGFFFGEVVEFGAGQAGLPFLAKGVEDGAAVLGALLHFGVVPGDVGIADVSFIASEDRSDVDEVNVIRPSFTPGLETPRKERRVFSPKRT